MTGKIVQLWDDSDEANVVEAYPVTIVDAIYGNDGKKLTLVGKYEFAVATTDKQFVIVKGGTGTSVPSGWYLVQVYKSDGTMIVPNIEQDGSAITLTFSEDITGGKAVLIG